MDHEPPQRNNVSNNRDLLSELVSGDFTHILSSQGLAASGRDARALVDMVIESAVEFPAAEPVGFELVTADTPDVRTVLISGEFRSARSFKPGNILLDVRRFCTDSARDALAIVGAIARPWTVPLVLLLLWNSLWSKLNVDVTPTQAEVLWDLWALADESCAVNTAHLQWRINDFRKARGLDALDAARIETAIAELERFHCLDQLPTTIKLRERIEVQFR